MCSERLRVSAGTAGLAVLLVLSACVTASPTTYRESRGLTPKQPGQVDVFWIEPEWPYRRIGEVTVRACPACSKAQIETEIREAVAGMGGNLAVVASDATRSGGALMVPGTSPSAPRTFVPVHRRDLIVIAGLRLENEFESAEATDPEPLPAERTDGLPDPAASTVSFETVPQSVEVYLDGEFIGTTPLPNYPVSPGRHHVAYGLPGYIGWSRTLLVRPGASTVVRAALEQLR